MSGRTIATARKSTGGKRPSSHKRRSTKVTPKITKRKKRLKPGQRAEMEVRHYQKTTDLLIPKLPFSRLVRQLGYQMKTDLRWKKEAIEAIQEECERYLTQKFTQIQDVATHTKRKTVMKRDITLVQLVEDKNKPIP